MAAEQVNDVKDVNEFGRVVLDFLGRRDMDATALCGLLAEAGHPVSEDELWRKMAGEEWVDARLPGCLVEVLELDVEGQGRLARAVAYGQMAFESRSASGR